MENKLQPSWSGTLACASVAFAATFVTNIIMTYLINGKIVWPVVLAASGGVALFFALAWKLWLGKIAMLKQAVRRKPI